MNIDWKKVWEKVKPLVVQIVIALLSGGAVVGAYHECVCKPAIQTAAAQK